MIKVYIGKIFASHSPKKNHRMVIESPIDFMNFELEFSKSVDPFTGGILATEDVIRLRDFLNEVINVQT